MMNYLISMNRHIRITIFFSLFATFIILMPFVGDFWFLSFLLSLTSLGILIASNVSHAKNYSSVMEKSLEKALINNNFHANSSYLSDDYLSGIALNKEESKIAVFKRFDIKDEFESFIYNFNEILECSIKEDGDTVTKTVSSSLISRSIVGGVLFGGVGATVGGLSSEKIASERIFKATLSIVFDDIDYPIREIDFLNSNMLIERNNPLYQKVYADLNRWHKTISIIIKRNEKELNSKSV